MATNYEALMAMRRGLGKYRISVSDSTARDNDDMTLRAPNTNKNETTRYDVTVENMESGARTTLPFRTKRDPEKSVFLTLFWASALHAVGCAALYRSDNEMRVSLGRDVEGSDGFPSLRACRKASKKLESVLNYEFLQLASFYRNFDGSDIGPDRVVRSSTGDRLVLPSDEIAPYFASDDFAIASIAACGLTSEYSVNGRSRSVPVPSELYDWLRSEEPADSQLLMEPVR